VTLTAAYEANPIRFVGLAPHAHFDTRTGVDQPAELEVAANI